MDRARVPFRLERLLRLRRREERIARDGLRAARAEVARLERDEERLHSALRACRAVDAGPAAALGAALGTAYAGAIERLAAPRARAASAVEVAETDWRRARTDADVLARLRLRRAVVWRKTVARAEQRTVDEFLVARSRHDRRGGSRPRGGRRS